MDASSGQSTGIITPWLLDHVGCSSILGMAAPCAATIFTAAAGKRPRLQEAQYQDGTHSLHGWTVASKRIDSHGSTARIAVFSACRDW